MIIELLKTNKIFINNEYLVKYINLILANKETKKQKNKTQVHHIIPRSVCQLCNFNFINKEENLVNLLYKDHLLAHYYLCFCLKDYRLKYKMFASINFMLGKIKQDNIEELPNFIDFINTLPNYQKLYEEMQIVKGKIISESLKGHSFTQESKDKISKANKGRVYVHKDSNVKSIFFEELDLYLANGWIKGNPNACKRKLSTGQIIVNKDNIEKYIDKSELNNYLCLGWKKGRTNSHIEATKKGTQKYYDSLSKEEKNKKCATRQGQHWKMSEETKEKIRKSNTGKKRSENQKLLNSLNKKNTIHMTNGIINKMVKPELEPELLIQGFWRGRTIKKRNNNKK